MLEPPDIYKKFAELAKEQVQNNIENNLISNYTQSDFLHAEKINKKRYLAVIERLITKCPINNDYEKQKKKLQEYTKKYIDENYPLLKPETMLNLLSNFRIAESLNLINPPLQAFILYFELIHQLHFYIQEKYVKKSKDNQVILVHNFVEYSLELLNGICSLLLAEKHNSVISIYRTFYENYIIFNFLQHHTELTEAFFDHATMNNCILKMKLAEINKSSISPEINEVFDELISKYGKDFKDDYGWTSMIIPERNKRNLRTMFEESQLGANFNYLYRISCLYSHSTAFSLMVRPDFNQIVAFLIEITNMVEKEVKTLLNKVTLKTVKEEALLYDWLGVTTDNFRIEINKWYENK